MAAKYAAVLEAGVGGVGMWTADATHRDSVVDTAVLAKEMWAVVRNAITAA
jgi:tRNA A37 threonylcarbamoyladenosine dehydratase